MIRIYFIFQKTRLRGLWDCGVLTQLNDFPASWGLSEVSLTITDNPRKRPVAGLDNFCRRQLIAKKQKMS